MYAGINVAEGITVEPFIAIRDRANGANGDEMRYHMGGRVVGKNIPWLPGVDITLETAFQTGRTTNNASAGRTSGSIDAYAGAYDVGYIFKNVPWTPRIGYSYVFASGDNDPNDNDSETFDHLYPTQHATMGYIDFHSWQNIRNHQFHLTMKPSKKLLLKADYHTFRADQRLDSWYNVAGKALGGSAGVSTDEDYGQEIDITLKYKLMKNFGVVLGYSHYFTDDFVEDYANRNNTPAGSGNDDEDADWFYIMTTMKF